MLLIYTRGTGGPGKKTRSTFADFPFLPSSFFFFFRCNCILRIHPAIGVYMRRRTIARSRLSVNEILMRAHMRACIKASCSPERATVKEYVCIRIRVVFHFQSK